MNPIGAELARYAGRVAELSAQLGRRVDLLAMGVTDRSGELALGPAGEVVSPNGACRMFRAADGWMALNLARDEDRDLVPAWLTTEAPDEPWALIAAEAARHTTSELVERARLLGLPAARVGEVNRCGDEPVRFASEPSRPKRARPPPKINVIDLSALWAGPMCGAILARMGAMVTKIESAHRPDPTRLSTPGLDARLNGSKARVTLDLAAPEGQAELRARVAEADVLITSARQRGLRSIGLDPTALLAARPGLTWVAITGYGWDMGRTPDDPPERVAFGDDAAAAGGLVGWTDAGEPRFLGDALSDPLTGAAAAVSAMAGVLGGGGCVVDAAMAQIASRAAAGRAS
jgi:crotonobetainyl-CoA:carnitine CoA-transferase CaiB-like acyl-CoA transferase